MTLDLVSLRRIMPRLRNAEDWLGPINLAAEEYGFTQPHRMAIWLANVAVETSELSRLEESFSYSPERMAQVWPRRFANADGTPNSRALSLAGKPGKLASEVYANRMGNGGPETLDGWTYRGRATPMLTGKQAYAAASYDLKLDLVEQPDLVNSSKEMSARVGGWFWHIKGIEDYADEGDIRNVRKLWNGGLVGFPEVQRYWRKANTVLDVRW